MARVERWVVAFLGAAAAACSGDGGGGAAAPSGPGQVAIPAGDDSLMPLASLPDSPQGVLYSSIAVGGGYGYVCTGGQGMRVAKIASPDQISVAVSEGKFAGAPGCREVVIAGDGAVVVTGTGFTPGSWIAVMAPGGKVNGDGDLELQSQVAIADAVAEDLAATKDRVFAALGEKGLAVFSRAGGTLTEVARLSQGFDQALGVTTWGDDKLVVANALGGLLVVDVSDPAKPKIVKTVKVFGTARRVQVVGDQAWVASAGVGVGVYDLTTSKPDARIGSWPTHSSAVDLSVTSEGLVFVANWEDLVVLDASDPKHPKMVGSERLQTGKAVPHVVGVQAEGHVGYVAEWSGVWSYVYAAGRSAPDIHLSRTRIDFGVVAETKYKGKGILVDNYGEKPLTIAGTVTSDDHFKAEWSDGCGEADTAKGECTVKPGDTAFLQVTFTATDMKGIEGTVTFGTNDPDEATLTLPLTGNKLDGVQVGGPFSQDPELIFQDVKTGGDVSVPQKYPNTVVLLAYFATW